MDEREARAAIRARVDAPDVGTPGGAPGDQVVRASEVHADDAVVEWPQGGERLRGKAATTGSRSTYAARRRFELDRTTGRHDRWVTEYTIHDEDRPVVVVGITDRDGTVVRERIYPGDPWEPPSRRARWVERYDPREPGSSAGA